MKLGVLLAPADSGGRFRGGIVNAIVGAAIIDGIAAAFAIQFGIATAVRRCPKDERQAALRFSADVMSGIPSIIIGIFAYTCWCELLAILGTLPASFAIGLLMLPIIMRASETAIRSVPKELPEAAVALGHVKPRSHGASCFPPLCRASSREEILAFARGAGETAPLLFTAIGSSFLVTNPGKPMASVADRHLQTDSGVPDTRPDRLGRRPGFCWSWS